MIEQYSDVDYQKFASGAQDEDKSDFDLVIAQRWFDEALEVDKTFRNWVLTREADTGLRQNFGNEYPHLGCGKNVRNQAGNGKQAAEQDSVITEAKGAIGRRQIMLERF